jgi:NAD(P)-dependent dehydrogenase (short-subunit alcohol dehydrogenase family)
MTMSAYHFDLTGKGALVTGSSRGIGKAIAEMLAALGANVIISSRKQQACDEVASEIVARGAGRAKSIPANIGTKADFERLVAEARQTLIVDGGATVTAGGV